MTLCAIDPTRLISGTFLGLDHFSDEEATRFQSDLRSLTEEHWRRMIRDMHAIGMDTLVFQQCATRRGGSEKPVAYYVSPTRTRMPWLRGDTFGAVIAEATSLGMLIFYGVGDMNGPDPYLAPERLMADVAITMRELFDLYGGLPSFGGWYWTSEYPPSSVMGRDSLRRCIGAARAIRDAPIMIAPTADRGMSAALLSDIDVDIVAYQDGVGLNITPKDWNRFPETDRYRSLHRLPILYDRLKSAHDGYEPPDASPKSFWNYYTRRRGRTAIWNDLEVWEFDHRGALIPAEMSRVQSQLELTAPYVEKQIIFQYPGLLCHPDFPVKVGGERAVELYEQYAAYRENLLNGVFA
jgi:hypothetical protein